MIKYVVKQLEKIKELAYDIETLQRNCAYLKSENEKIENEVQMLDKN